MNILHYTLGIPPKRSGGLTKYATDLAYIQSSMDNVSILYPGDVDPFITESRIKKKRNKSNVKLYEIINPLVVPLLYGIKIRLKDKIDKYSFDEERLEEFYKTVRPDIFHIHTLMGLSLDLLFFLKNKGVKIVYTSNDYYGLCLKVNFIDVESKYCSNPTHSNCAKCNLTSPSVTKLRLRNCSWILSLKPILKNKIILRITNAINALRSRSNTHCKSNIPIDYISEDVLARYQMYIDYFKEIFKLVDFFHFNSSVSQEVYCRYLRLDRTQYSIISITHNNIVDNRRLKQIKKDSLTLIFIGSLAPYKGYPLLKEILLGLVHYPNWRLYIYGANRVGVDDACDRIFYKGNFKENEQSEIFQSADLLIIPSLCKETFGLVALEAISNGVPALVSSNVGAQDIVKQYDPEFIYDSDKDLQIKLSTIFEDPSILKNYNYEIYNRQWSYSLQEHSYRIKKMYESIL